MSASRPTCPPDGGVVVGVALPVPEPWGAHLQRLREAYGDEQAATVPTHITLLPPTPATAEELTGLRAHLEAVSEVYPPFTVRLRGTGTFRPVSEVVFIQLAEGVSSCERLQAAVRGGPVERDLAYPYHPHVTVAQDVPRTHLERAFHDLAAFRCDFTADHFVLYVHDGDEVWETDRTYALHG